MNGDAICAAHCAKRDHHEERLLAMLTGLFWIEGPWLGRMAISSRPRGGERLDDEMKAWRRAGVDVVVSLLEPAEAEDLGLDEERKYCEANGMEFYALPIVDRSVPASSMSRRWQRTPTSPRCRPDWPHSRPRALAGRDRIIAISPS